MIQSSLKERAILVDFDGGYYDWHRRDKKVEKDVGSRAGVNSAAGRYKKNIFLDNDIVLHSLRQIVQHAREASNNMTLPWHPSRRLLLNLNFLKHTKMVQEHESAIAEVLEHLDEHWDEMLEGARTSLGNLFVSTDYPNLSDVKAATYIKATFYPIGDDTDIRLSADEEMVERIKEEVRKSASRTYDDAIFHVWEKLYSAVSNAKENLDKVAHGADGRFRTEWYSHLEELVPVLKGLNLDGDKRLDEMADRLSTFLDDHEERQLKRKRGVCKHAASRMEDVYNDLTAVFGPMRQQRGAAA